MDNHLILLDYISLTHWPIVDIGSGNGLVLSGNKPFPEPIWTWDIWCHMELHGHKIFTENFESLCTIDDETASTWLMSWYRKHQPVYWYLASNIPLMMTSSDGKMFRVTGNLCVKFTGHRWIPHTKASDAEHWCFFFICTSIKGWVNNCEAGDFRCHHAHYDVIEMLIMIICKFTMITSYGHCKYKTSAM